MKLTLPRWRATPAGLPPLFAPPQQAQGLGGVLVMVLGLLAAAFFGLATAVLPWQYLVGLFGLPVLFLLGAAMPTLLFVVALLLLFGVMPEFIMAALPLGGATLRPAELVLIFCFIVVLARLLLGRMDLLSLLKPLRGPLLVLAAGFTLGFVDGKLISGNTLALADARQFTGWLALPIALWLSLAHPGRLQRIIVGVALLAATLMILQLGLGVQLIFGFRGAEYLSKEFTDVTRSAIGGGLFFLAFAAYRLFLHACDGTRWRWLALLGSLVTIGGIVASFNRAIWAGFVVGALVLLILKPRTRHSALMPFLALLLGVALGLAGLALAKPRTAEAVVERVTSLSKEGQRGSSLGFRFDENRQALDALRARPLFGLGFGGEYKRAYRQLSTAGGFDIEDSFIHNGYLSLWLKWGAFGLLFPPMLLWAVWRIARVRLPGDAGGASALERHSVLACFAMLMVSAITSPDWSQSSTIAAIASLLAVLLTSYAASQGKAAAVAVSPALPGRLRSA